MTDELHAESIVPQAGAPVTGAMWREIRRIEAKVDRILRAVSKDPLDPAAPDGLVQMQEAHGRHLQDLETRVTDLEDAREQTAATWRNRGWSILAELAKLAGAAGLGAWIGKGGH